jgi:uncharacterized protein
MIQRLRRLLPTQESLRSSRWLRWLGPALHHPRLWHMSRRGIALGVAIGVFFAFLVPIAQIPLSAGAAMLLRANVPSAVASTLVNNPLTFPPVYYAAWKVGSLVLGRDAPDELAPQIPTIDEVYDPDDPRSFFRRTIDNLRSVGKPLLVGALLFATVFGLTAYALVNGIWHWRVRVKRRRRLRRRDNRATQV